MSDDTAITHERIFRMIDAFQASAALKGAVELGLFTALGDKRKSAAALASDVRASERGVRILCDFLTIQGLLQKQGEEYRSSPDAAVFLDENSPAYLGSVTRFMISSAALDWFSDIAGVVRKGRTLKDGEGTVAPDHPIWVDFAREMAPAMKPSAAFIGDLVTSGLPKSKPLKVLDIAAGHGLFGVEIAARHPLAEIVALDWPAVLEVASENAKKAGVGDRFSQLPGSAFDVDFGDGYDIVLLTNFLHHFDVETCTDLMKKVHASLNEGGRAVTLEFVPNEDRVTPPPQAAFALFVLATTPAGNVYTFEELASMAANAGFTQSTLHRIPGPPQAVVLSKK